ncbi:MAG: Uma2 family endonuclease [Candidatus Riflebacteria bacterium]|nr:Uma2 family endonuclease [Candidatus Riflebacteria bacterium]
MKPVPNEERLFTYGDYLTWPDEERWEIIDGVPYAMTGPGLSHQRVSGRLLRVLLNFLEGKPCEVFHAPFDVRLPKAFESENEINTVVQPDIMVVCDSKKLDEKGIRGSPDLLMEIVSPSTASMDYVKKLRLYERHKVREYWVIHPLDKTIIVFRLGKNGSYNTPKSYSFEKPDQRKVKVGIFEDFYINLEDIFK